MDEFSEFQHAWHAQFMLGRNLEFLIEKWSSDVPDPNEAIETLCSETESAIRQIYQDLLDNYPGCPARFYAKRWIARYDSKNGGID